MVKFKSLIVSNAFIISVTWKKLYNISWEPVVHIIPFEKPENRSDAIDRHLLPMKIRVIILSCTVIGNFASVTSHCFKYIKFHLPSIYTTKLPLLLATLKIKQTYSA